MFCCWFHGLGCMTDRYAVTVSRTYNWVPPLCFVLFFLLLFPGFSVILFAVAKLRKGLLASSCLFVRLSVRTEWTGRNFIKFYVCLFFRNPSGEFKLHKNLTRLTGTLLEDLCKVKKKIKVHPCTGTEALYRH